MITVNSISRIEIPPYNPINIKDYGAKGDGVTDDTKAIKAAIAAAPPYAGGFIGLGGVAIYFPPGNYIISETIEIDRNCWLYGAGRDGTTGIRLADHSNCDMFHIGRKGAPQEPVTPTIKGIVFSMDRTKQAAGCANIRFFNMIRHGIFYDLFFRQATDANLVFEVEEGFSIYSRNNYFQHVSCEYAVGAAIRGRHSYNLNFFMCYFGFGIGAGYKALDINMSSAQLNIINNWFLTNISECNIEIQSTQRVNITGNTFRTKGDNVAGTSIINLRFGMDNVIIANNNISVDSNYQYGFRLGRATNVLVHDNIVKGYYDQPFTSTEEFASQHIYNNIVNEGFQPVFPIPE
jgi:hypothetical protein